MGRRLAGLCTSLLGIALIAVLCHSLIALVIAMIHLSQRLELVKLLRDGTKVGHLKLIK